VGILSKAKKAVGKVAKAATKQGALGVATSLATGNVLGAATGAVSLMAKPKAPAPAARAPIAMAPSHAPSTAAMIQVPPTVRPVAAGISAGGLLDVAAKVGSVLEGVQAARNLAAPPAPVASSPGAVRYPVTSDPSTFGALGTDKVGRPIVAGVTYSARAKAPKGYVVVQHPTLGVVAMLKGLARASGLWRPRPKPPISVGDWRAISRASRASKRVAKAAKSAGYVVTRRGSGRRAARSPFKRKR